MRRVITAISIICLTCLVANAQEQVGIGSKVRSGSVYSSIGVGSPLDLGSSSATGMGLSGVSFDETFVPGITNPAQWGSTVYGMATGGLSLKSLQASDDQNSVRNTLIGINYFQAQLPLIRRKLGISASLRPYTESSYNFVEEGTKFIGSGATRDTLQFQTENKGSGGITAFELGFGWNITDNISIGYAGALMFASIDDDVRVRFGSLDFETVSFTRETSGVGFGNRAGFKLDLPGVFNENDQISIGSAVSFPINLDSERVETTNSGTTNNFETFVIDEGKNLGSGEIQLPLKWHGGITYYPNRSISISTEGLYENWSSFSSDFDDRNDLLTDRYKIGVGMRYFPYINGSDKFLSNFKYRFGVSYDTGHLDLRNERIETVMFSFGLGILSPKPNSYSSIDISLQYGIRGTRTSNLVKENFWGLQLSLNLAELMFTRPKLR